VTIRPRGVFHGLFRESLGSKNGGRGKEAEMYIGIGSVLGLILLILLLIWIF
jgi:hypothetical protein